ncbi:protein transport protein Sec31A [Protopterus annectens]|uniref:protein transport protein Sec31A n=1 Tax=Protopterus annectens TaxID=7888 RepID=UPI001CFB69DE|nr:protein transport protein Sec31A [Protopterus annectens]
MKLKEIDRTAIQVWSPAQHHPIYLAAGTSAQQLDATFSTNASLEIFELDLADITLDMKSCGTLSSSHRYHKLVWGPHGMESNAYPAGVLIAGGENGSIILYNPSNIMSGNNDAVIAHNEKHTGPVRALDSNPFQSNLVASGANESEIYIWDLNNFNTPMTPGAKCQPLEDISCIAWNRQVQHILASASPSGRATVWDLRKNEPIIKVSDHSNRMHCSGMAWHPDVATQLVLASEDDRMPVIQMWDLRFATSPLRVLENHTRGILAIAWSLADAELLLSCGKDNRILCWNPNTSEVLYELPTSTQWCFDIQWCPRNPAILSAAAFDGHISIYSIMGGSIDGQRQKQVDKLSSSFGNLDPFGTGQALPPLQMPQQTTQQSIILPLKKPPKWLRRPVGASFALIFWFMKHFVSNFNFFCHVPVATEVFHEPEKQLHEPIFSLNGLCTMSINPLLKLTPKDLLHGKDADISIKHGMDIILVTRRLENKIQKLKTIQWQKQHMEACLSFRLVPRGLRILKMPTYGNTYPELLSKWQKLNLDTSFCYIKLLIEQYSKIEETLTTEIDVIEQELKCMLNSSELDVIYSDLRNMASSVDHKALQDKKRKLERDYLDFLNGHVFSWPRDKPAINFKKFNHTSDTNHVQDEKGVYSKQPTIPSTMSAGKESVVSLPSSKEKKEHGGDIRTTEAGSETSHQDLVYNISRYALTEFELRVLSKGLSFIPSSYTDVTDIILDIKFFTRNISLKLLFGDDTIDTSVVNSFKKPTFIPPSNSVLEAFERACEKDLFELYARQDVKPNFYNMSNDERQALLSLQNNMSIIIRQDDKGGPVIVMDKDEYMNKIDLLLADDTTYSVLSGACLNKLINNVHSNLYDYLLSDVIDTGLYNYFLVENPLVPTFRGLPKIHKDMLDPPLRSIVSKSNELKPIVTTDFLVTLDVNFEDDSRSKYLNLLGYKKEDMGEKIAAALKGESSMNGELETLTKPDKAVEHVGEDIGVTEDLSPGETSGKEDKFPIPPSTETFNISVNGEHARAIRTLDSYNALARHASKCRQFEKFNFLVLEQVAVFFGDSDTLLEVKELKWQLTLAADLPPGLNEYINIKCALRCYILFCFFLQLKLITAVVSQDWKEIVQSCDLQNWREALAAVLTYARPDEFSALCDLLGTRLECDGDDNLQAQACLCYICAGNIEKLVACWTKSKDGNTPLLLQDLVEKVVILRKAVEITQTADPNIMGALLAEKMSQYANLLAAQGRLAAALAYLPASTNQQTIIHLRERLFRAQGELSGQGMASFSADKQPKGRVPSASAVGTMQQQAVHSPQQYYPPARVAPTVTSWSNQTPTALPSHPSPASDTQGENPPPVGFILQGSNNPAVSSQSAVQGYNMYSQVGSHQAYPPPFPQPQHYPHGMVGPAVYQPQQSSVPPVSAAYQNVPYMPSAPHSSTSGTVYSGQHPPSPAGFNPGSSFPPPPPSGASYQHGGPGAPAASLSYAPPTGPTGTLPAQNELPASQGTGDQTTQSQTSLLEGPQNGWNDPPAFNRTTKKTKGPQVYTPLAPITSPIMNAVVDSQSAVQQPLPSVPQSSLPQTMQVPFQPVQQPVGQPVLQPPYQNVPSPLAQPTLQPSSVKSNIEGAPGAPTGNTVQPLQSLPSEKVTKKPIPDEHLILKTTFETLIQKCLTAATDPQTKRKLDDANKRLEFLYDKLRDQTLSPTIINGLHTIAKSIESRNYVEGLNVHTHIVGTSNFSETSAFMPVLKVLLTQANKLCV